MNNLGDKQLNLVALIKERANILSDVGIESAHFEAELIFCHVMELDRLNLYMHGEKLLKDKHLEIIDGVIARRKTRHPLQFILGESEFYGRRFEVTEDVMAPTPETELLCEKGIGWLNATGRDKPKILDVGTGSGVIALTLASEIPGAIVTAVDISDKALAVARGNARLLEVENRVTFRTSDMLSAIEADEKFDLIISNPPYVTESDYKTVQPEVLADPKISITGGDDGLDLIRVLLRDAPGHIVDGGRLMFEIGYDQSALVLDLTTGDNRYTSIDILRDYNDIDRVIILKIAAT